MSDLISRQAAIDAMINSRSNADVTLVPGSYTNGWIDGRKQLLDELLQVIFELPSAQPETHDKRTETHACDLISREAAIDGKICIQRANGVEIYDDYAVPVEYLKQLPPANCSEFPNNSDTISRQAAIDAIDNANDGLVEDDYTYGVQSGMEKAKYVIEELSSAQLKTGKWIRDELYPTYAKCSICGYSDEYTYEDNYCPNCGAKMEGEEHD